jgi:DUF4097 and DUF4098 domain-containing protein YvlB
LFGLGLLLVAALALGGCIGGNITAEETVSQSFDMGVSPRIVVETFNGRIDVKAGAEGRVAVDVVKRGAGFSQTEAEADLQNVEVTMIQEGDTLRIVARRTDSALVTGNSGASVDLSVPPGSSLDLRSSNGNIDSFGVTGGVTMDTSNGSLEVRGGAGRLDLNTSNGEIEIEADEALVDASTSNGRITFRGSLADGDQRFRTSNGRIAITLPAGTRFRIDASTSNGDVSTDFPVTLSGSARDNELAGRVGENPAMSITATSSNGDIDIRQGG